MIGVLIESPDIPIIGIGEGTTHSAPEPTASFAPISLAVFVPERARALAGARGMA